MESFIQAIENDDEAVLRSDRTWGAGNWVTCLHAGGIVRHRKDLVVDDRTGERCPRSVPAPAPVPAAPKTRQSEPR